ncbi:MAG: peptidylprolyl isomerase [Polaromonas sp.]|uniref:peptidylprolyl isomerase n=1 Tax=Polaromonas sp. TaxID=1869339 RepID=UPI0025E1C896|nr:peptidylprolyl isomerase [Polaromonas sp.]MBI2727617.1 peptidylprolyl isomerase [Polaromonas sp.]
MTKHLISSRVAARSVFDSRVMAALALVFSAMAVDAQGLRPSGALRLPDRAVGAANAGGQRQADFIVAVVNSEPVTNNEVRSKLVRAEQQLSQRGSAMPPRNELALQVLERLISDKAQLQMARTSGIRVDDNAVENAVAAVAQQNQLTIDELRRRLVADGIPYAQFRSELRDELLVTRLRQREVDSRVTVTEADIDQFLRDQEGSNDAAAIELNLVQILVPVPENATAEQLAALQARASQVAQRARAGGDFAALANEFSDAQVRLTGGQMGLRAADRYPPLFLEATQNLAAGGVAGPVRSGAGFHILKVLEKKKAGVPGVNITQTRARHILLRPTPQLTEAGAVEKLLNIKKRVAAGQADFAKEAQENSVDGSAKDGGDLGWTNPGSFVPEFEQAMNGLSPGQISDPVISRFGAHLIQVLERRVTQLSERDQRELVRGIVREKKQEEAYSLWAQEVRGRAYVEYREPPQ